jgi:cytochrome oxidase Cu insertion factor (SCO1/SenC/PrrC family)
MRSLRLASAATALVLCSWLGGAWAQDVYRADGRWLDDQARAYRLDALRGMPTVVTMAYGACRRVCSTSLRVMEKLQALADERRVDMNFVVIGLDPAEDKPADWAEFRAERKLRRANWQFLSGDEASTRALASRLGVHYWRYGEHTMHDFKIVLLSPQGQPLRSIDRFDQPLATLLP